MISAWESLHGRELATLTVEFDGGDGPEPHTIDRLLSYVHHPDRELRLAALDVALRGVGAARQTCRRPATTRSSATGSSVDRLRGDPRRDVADEPRNELDGEVVETMIGARRGALPGRAAAGSCARREVLGLDRLQLADQYAPVGSDRRVEWTEAVEMVEASLRRLRARGWPRSSRTCLERGHVDAEPRPGKVGGAYCSSISKTVLPFVLMNYTDQLSRRRSRSRTSSAMRVHGTLALERQPYRSYHTGLALAEVPSTFAQLLAVERLIDQEEDQATRVMLLADRAEGAMASIFRQTMMARFEQRAYGVRGEGKALTRDRLVGDLDRGERSATTATRSSCPRGTGSAGRTSRTSSTSASTPTRTRSRTSSRSRSRRATARIPSGSSPAYLEFLASGASRSPQDLLAPIGVDLRNPQTWADAFAEFDRCVTEAEAGVAAL